MSDLSLAERLGYGPDDKLLIVNCDDLGSSASANRATAHVLAEGLATSATLMVPCPWAVDGAKRKVEGGVGVHLTLTAEYQAYRWRSLTGAASLHDHNGFMPRSAEEVWAKADLDDVRAECQAQIDQAYGWGVDVTHLDAHMGTMQTDPRYFEILLDLAKDYDLPVRMWGPAAERELGFPGRDRAASRGLVFPDYMTSTWGKPAKPTFAGILERLRPGVTEVYVHPVEDGPELRSYDTVAFQTRIDDYACLLDDELKAQAAGLGVTLIDFKPLRDLQRAAA